MSWELAILAAQVGTSLFKGLSSGNASRNAAIASNKETKKLNEANYEQNKKTWELNFLQTMSQYAWAIAETEGARYQDSVKKADYEKQQGSIIDSTIQNLLLNSEALEDKYVTAENIRYNDEVRDAIFTSKGLGLDNSNDRLGSTVDRFQNKITTQSQLNNSAVGLMLAKSRNNLTARAQTQTNNMQYRDARDIIQNNEKLSLGRLTLDKQINKGNINLERDTQLAFNNMEAAQSNRQAMSAVAQYMQGIKAKKIESDALLSQTENAGTDIQEQIVLAEQLDALERDAQYAAAITESAVRKNQAAVRQGGSNSSDKISLDSMQAFGRTYGQMRVEQNARRQKMASFNASVQGEVAQQFSAIANETETLKKSIFATKKLNKLRNNQYQFRSNSINAAADLQLQNNNVRTKADKFSIKQQADDQLVQLLNNKNAANGQLELGRQLGNRSAKYDKKLSDIGTKATSKLNRYAINKGAKLNNQDYRLNFNNNKSIFNQSTLQGFGLANRQGQREFQALVQNAFNTVNVAATPYREAIINDPLLPIAGLAPELTKSKEIYVPSTGSIVLDSAFDAASTLAGQASTDPNGNLTFFK